MTVFERLHMPSLGGATGWLNAEPLGPAELREHVVLVDFWTLTCINWLRQEPYVRAWSQAYRDEGLVVIGVHTPEFSFEHEVDRVRQATKERAIDYPVAADNGYGIWSAFDNHYWPALCSKVALSPGFVSSVGHVLHRLRGSRTADAGRERSRTAAGSASRFFPWPQRNLTVANGIPVLCANAGIVSLAACRARISAFSSSL